MHTSRNDNAELVALVRRHSLDVMLMIPLVRDLAPFAVLPFVSL